MEVDGVAEPTPIWGDRHDRPIEVHRPVLMGDIRGQELDFRPFGDEVGKSLRLNRGAGDIPDVVVHDLESPLRDLADDSAVTDDLPEWV